MILLVNSNAINIPLADRSVQCVVTSPPYFGQRDYGTARWEGGDPECDHTVGSGDNDNMKPHVTRPERDGTKRQYCQRCGAVRIDNQIGLEQTPDEYVNNIVQVFREVWRVLRDDGTVWLNLGDSYAGGKGQSGSSGAEHQEIRHKKGESINRGHQTLGGKKQTRPTDNNAMLRKYNIKPKDLIGIPWLVAFALRADGWYLRQDIIWAKGCSGNYTGGTVMPESVKDRCTKAHEYIFLLTKSARYYYDYEAILEVATSYDGRKDTMFKGAVKSYDGVMPDGKPQTFAQRGRERWKYKNLQYDGQEPNTMHIKRLDGEEYLSPVRNRRSVWTVTTKPYHGSHFAVFPPDLIEPCILAGSAPDDVVLDPFSGSGTTCMVARKHGRRAIGLDLNFNYLNTNARERLVYGDYVHVADGVKQLTL